MRCSRLYYAYFCCSICFFAFHSAYSFCPSSLSKNAYISGSRTQARARNFSHIMLPADLSPRGHIYPFGEVASARICTRPWEQLVWFCGIFLYIIRLVRDKRSKVYFNLATAVSTRYSVHQMGSCLVAAIYAILLFINPPNAKIHQINAAATISFITIPTLVLD